MNKLADELQGLIASWGKKEYNSRILLREFLLENSSTILAALKAAAVYREALEAIARHKYPDSDESSLLETLQAIARAALNRLEE